MIMRLAIENFKSIRSLELRCGRVNIFIGEPNAGKSNILEALGLLSYMAHQASIEDYVRTDKLYQLFHNYDIRNPIRITVDNLELTASFREGKIGFTFTVKDVKGASSIGPIEHVPPLLVDPSLRNKLSFVRFYRFKPDVVFKWNTGSFLAPPDGRNLPSVLALNPSLMSLVQTFFEGFGQKLVPNEFEQTLNVMWELEGNIRSFPYKLVSDTLRRLIFHLAAVESNDGATIIMEEPEAHAFPTYTKYLAERVALDERNQYFISTHNPYFLLSLVEKAPVGAVAVYVTYLVGCETKAKLLTEDELEELMDMASAVFFNLDVFTKGLPGA